VRKEDEIQCSFTFDDFLKILYQATSKRFRIFKDVFHIRWINIIPQR